MPPTPDMILSGDSAIRPYTELDWAAVCRIHDGARVQELAAAGVDPRAFRPMTEAAEADEFFDSETAVACLSDRVAGFVSWNGAYVTWLYIDSGTQRRGIGRPAAPTRVGANRSRSVDEHDRRESSGPGAVPAGRFRSGLGTARRL
jgi:hypothetical protein